MNAEDPYQDSGSEYLPTRSPSPYEDLLDILDTENQSPNNIHPIASPQNDEAQIQKPRKRVRQPSKQKKNIRKVKRVKGEEYINTKGNTVPSKTINTDIPCKCEQKFHDKVGAERQKELFDSMEFQANLELDILYPVGKTISVEKKKDLLELLQYIPPINHNFYKNIKENAAERNDLYVEEELGRSGSHGLILRMLDRDPGFRAASLPRTAFESDLIFLAQSAACSFASRGMLRAMARYAKSWEVTLRNSGMLESPLTEAEQRELALVRDECRSPAPRLPLCAGRSQRWTPAQKVSLRQSAHVLRRIDRACLAKPSETAAPPAAPLAGRAAGGATDATSFGSDDPVAPAGDGAAPRMPVVPSYAVMVAAPTAHAQHPRALEAPKKPAYPPIVITRAYGKGYRISPESADEYRVIQRYLSDLEKEDRRVSWFPYSIPVEKDLKVAIRGIPVTTDPEELAQSLRALGTKISLKLACPYVDIRRPQCRERAIVTPLMDPYALKIKGAEEAYPRMYNLKFLEGSAHFAERSTRCPCAYP
ncbi:unnamed protein product [Pieris brassicae]|uniref:Uncharacterized protein n=1 Tax=Pieris brassicae TaxID=7116 RepID=A0A9P0TL37_PIEBR|nr:unnamed protein product [Pieris brassicae]